MTISTQTMGVVTMAMVAVTGLAVSNSVVQQRSVGERMLFYQAEEIAMDIEIMEDWGEDSKVTKKMNNKFSYIGVQGVNPQRLVLEEGNVRTETPIQPVNNLNVDTDGVVEDFSYLCITKTGGSTITLDDGAC